MLREEAPGEPEAVLRRMVAEHAGQRLPGERSLAASLHLSRPHLRGLLGQLRREGLIEARQGSGTFAAALPDASVLQQAALWIDRDLKLGDDPFFSTLVEALQAEMQAVGIRCFIERVGGKTQPAPAYTSAIITLGRVGAIAAVQNAEDVPVVLLLPGGDLPFRPAPRTSVFQLNDYAGGQEAVRLLMAQNCQRIVFFGKTGIAASDERRRGMEHEAARCGIPWEIIETRLNYAGGWDAGRGFSPPNSTMPLGFIAANDWLAAGLRAGLTAAASHFPLVSFDGLPLAAAPSLAITSLAVPLSAIASDAVAELIRLARFARGAGGGRTVLYPLTPPASE